MTDFYYCSEEFSRPELPVGCELLRYLQVESLLNKAAVIETANPIHSKHERRFVVLAKGNQTIKDVFDGELVGVYLMPLDSRATSATLDLSNGLQPVEDWGAITLTLDQAKQWQAK